MAKKTQVPKSTLAVLTEIQDAIDNIKANTDYVALRLTEAAKTVGYLRRKEATLSEAASSLRHLLKAQEHGPASPQGSDRPKPARRKMVVSNLQRVSSIRSRERKGQPRKRLSPKSSWPKDATHLPH